MDILFPVFAMFALTAFAAGRLAYLRVTAIRARQISIGYFRAYTGHEEPEKLRIASRHMINLFEMPTLFYVVVTLIFVTGTSTTALVALAWAYVALRAIHTAIHLGSNNVLRRFQVFVTSGLVLAALWVAFAVRLLGQGA